MTKKGDIFSQAMASLQAGRLGDAEQLFKNVLRQQPNHLGALNLLGIMLTQLQRYAEAESYLKSALKLNANSDVTLYNYGIILKALKRPGEALERFSQAISVKPDVAETWNNRGTVLSELKRDDEAIADFDRAIALQPNYAEASYNKGKSLVEIKHPNEALAAFDRALSLKPVLAEAWLGRGHAYDELKRFPEALAAFDQALSINPNLAEASLGRGGVFTRMKRYGDAVGAYERAMALKNDIAGAEGSRLFAKKNICDWTNYDAECARLIANLRKGNANVLPFELLSMSASPADQLLRTKGWIADKFPPSAKALWQGEVYRHDRIRIAYLSADFREHAVSYLVAGLFEAHDKSRFQTTGISFGPDDRSKIRDRIVRSFDDFVDAHAQGDADIAGMIRAREIDIVVDLTGLTADARIGIFAQRPAPIQVNFLGYSGTMGAPYIDYIIADQIVIPEHSRDFYVEKIVTMPDCYLANDNARVIADSVFSREKQGLPPSGFVFCCFNNNYKISPQYFDLWMRLLKQVEGSVLWLRKDNTEVVDHLRKGAAARGVDGERLLFAKHVADIDQHLARMRLADLFLDTQPYGAQTTASDALWSGLPILTILGETFVGRAAASLVTAIGLPELIAQDLAAYERMALELATAPATLAEIRRKLAANRQITPLFDTRRYTRHIEAAYTAMHRRQQAGLPPDHIVVPG
ncbi:MAG TPA: tetratricopeptide repeat protein [Pseudolabrys sp.]|jgi:predicted O-linked N-acetylglucosamine transferase (SPINDLY family)|nr:tetratricopeptide repeat protein [Pseudolabrys sp.]